MGLKYSKLQRLLQGKFSFVEASSHSDDHNWYELEISDRLTVRTKVSHGSGELGNRLEGKIARQLKVRTGFFREMVTCTKDAGEYRSQVLSDPYPPFEHEL